MHPSCEKKKTSFAIGVHVLLPKSILWAGLVSPSFCILPGLHACLSEYRSAQPRSLEDLTRLLHSVLVVNTLIRRQGDAIHTSFMRFKRCTISQHIARMWNPGIDGGTQGMGGQKLKCTSHGSEQRKPCVQPTLGHVGLFACFYDVKMAKKLALSVFRLLSSVPPISSDCLYQCCLFL